MKPLKPRAGVWAALGLLGAVAILGQVTTAVAVRATDWNLHTREVIEVLSNLRGRLAEADSARRAFALTRDEIHLADFSRAIADVPPQVAALRALTFDNPEQQQRLDELEPLIDLRLDQLGVAIGDSRAGRAGQAEERTATQRGSVTSAQILAIVTGMIDLEHRLLSDRIASTDRSIAAMRLGQLGGTAVSFVILLIVFARLRREIVLRTSSEAAVREASLRFEEQVVERTADLVALRAAKGAADTANRELEAFSYSVAHDLRAPLRGINGFAQALLEDYGGKLDGSADDFLRRINAGSERMGLLIDALLGLSRVARMKLDRTRVDLAELAQSVVVQLRAEDGRTVKLVTPNALVVSGDAQLLRAMLDNLLGNAWKFTSKQAAGCIEIGAVQGPEPTFFVRDNGAGFDMAYAEKLFAPFQRLHPAAEYPGTGIGLATVQRIVHRHGGRIWAEGLVGQGATFFFTLPNSGAAP